MTVPQLDEITAGLRCVAIRLYARDSTPAQRRRDGDFVNEAANALVAECHAIMASTHGHANDG